MLRHDDDWPPGNGWHMRDGGGWGMHDGTWGFWMMATIVVLLVLVPLIIAVVFLFLRQRPTQQPPAGPLHGQPRPAPDAMQILERRFAAGEIDEEEFRARSDALRAQRDAL